MPTFYYNAPLETKDHITTANAGAPVSNGKGVKFTNGVTKPVTVSANKEGSNAYLYASKLSRKDTITTNVDTVRSFYPNQNNFGTEYTGQSLYSADPQKLRISIF